MPHMVIFRSNEGKPGYHQAEALEDAVKFVEHLRNAESVAEARIFRMQEVPIEFKAYYRVEVAPPSGAAPASAPAASAAPTAEEPAAPAAAPPAPPAPSTPSSPAASAPPAAAAASTPAPAEDSPAPSASGEEPVPAEAGAAGSGRFGLFNRT